MVHNPAMSKSHTYRNVYDVPEYVTLDSALVDGAVWYTIDCTRAVADWIRTQDSALYYSHTPPVYAKVYGNVFDLHRNLYLMLGLKWT
jgi:hypothetical protein